MKNNKRDKDEKYQNKYFYFLSLCLHLHYTLFSTKNYLKYLETNIRLVKANTAKEFTSSFSPE